MLGKFELEYVTYCFTNRIHTNEELWSQLKLVLKTFVFFNGRELGKTEREFSIFSTSAISGCDLSSFDTGNVQGSYDDKLRGEFLPKTGGS